MGVMVGFFFLRFFGGYMICGLFVFWMFVVLFCVVWLVGVEEFYYFYKMGVGCE